MTRTELLARLCTLGNEVARARFRFPDVAADCFCTESAHPHGWSFQYDDRVVKYIERVVRAAITDTE